MKKYKIYLLIFATKKCKSMYRNDQLSATLLVTLLSLFLPPSRNLYLLFHKTTAIKKFKGYFFCHSGFRRVCSIYRRATKKIEYNKNLSHRCATHVSLSRVPTYRERIRALQCQKKTGKRSYWYSYPYNESVKNSWACICQHFFHFTSNRIKFSNLLEEDFKIKKIHLTLD